jgi:hypothetical protein
MYKQYKDLLDLSNLNVGIYQSKTRALVEVTSYSLVAFFFPFFFSQSQILLGTIVNCMLISGALYVKGKNLIPLIILPSLGALSRGFLFGPNTVYLIYMLPFIWIGNAILIFTIKFVHLKMKRQYVSGAVFGSVLKACFLFLSALLLYNLGVIPSVFLLTMGIIQAITSLSASFVMWPINKLRLKIHRKHILRNLKKGLKK